MSGAAPGHGAPALIEARGVTVRAGERVLLREVDLQVHPGEIVTLIGPNGAGKTTLVRTLLGIMKPATGEVLRRPELTLGYVPQRFDLDPVLPLTVHRFLTIGHRAQDAAIAAVLAEVGAAGLGARLLEGLSGGEFQRVLLARSLLRDPDLLILDEPVAGVDVGGQLSLYNLITRIRTERGCGVLLISHDLHLVMASTDRVVCLNQHVCCSGHPAAVMRDPGYLSLFGPRAAESLAVYTHDHDHTHEGGLQKREPLP